MIKIGLISDTHNQLFHNVYKVFMNVDIILHAGDISNLYILEKLSRIAPVKAVYGNVDIYNPLMTLTSKLHFNFEGFHTLLIHNIGLIKDFILKLKQKDLDNLPDLVIYGHTHIPEFQKIDNIYFANPGSAGKPKFGMDPTVMILDIEGKEILKHKIISLMKNK